MNKNQIKLFINSIFFGLLWAILLCLLGLIIKKITGNTLKSLLFAEGIMFIFFAILSAITGNSLGSLNTKLEQNDYEYLSNIALETKNLTKKTIIINNLKTSFSMLSLSLGGFLCILLTSLL